VDKIVAIVGGVNWAQIPSPHDTVRALGVLASIRTGRCASDKNRNSNLPHLANTVLLEPPERRIWTHAFELMCKSLHREDLLERPSVRGKCERNHAEMSDKMPIDRIAARPFDTLFRKERFDAFRWIPSDSPSICADSIDAIDRIIQPMLA